MRICQHSFLPAMADPEHPDEGVASEKSFAWSHVVTPQRPATPPAAQRRAATPRPEPLPVRPEWPSMPIDELLAAASRHIEEGAAHAECAGRLVAMMCERLHASGVLISHMSAVVERLVCENNVLRKTVECRPVLPPLPRSAAFALANYPICEFCQKYQNVIFGEDGAYMQVFCLQCCSVIAKHNHCTACTNTVYVDGLGNIAKYCKVCAPRLICRKPGCNNTKLPRDRYCVACGGRGRR